MATGQKKVVLGIDLDGVCADFYARIREIAAEWFEKPLEELTPDVTHGLKEWGIERPEQYDSLHRFAVSERNYFHALAVKQTIEWLDHHGIPYHDLCFMKEKEQVGADIYVEDSPTNVLSLRDRGFYTICFSNSTNKQIGDPKAETWDGVYELVRSWCK